MRKGKYFKLTSTNILFIYFWISTYMIWLNMYNNIWHTILNTMAINVNISIFLNPYPNLLPCITSLHRHPTHCKHLMSSAQITVNTSKYIMFSFFKYLFFNVLLQVNSTWNNTHTPCSSAYQLCHKSCCHSNIIRHHLLNNLNKYWILKCKKLYWI